MYDVNEIKRWFNETLSRNNLNVNSDYELIKNINSKIDNLSIINNSTFLDFYAIRDIYLSIEKIDLLKKI